MKQILLENLTRPLQQSLTVVYCDSFLCRLRGLTFRRSLPSGEGLMLVQARDSRLDSSIHMMFVWFDLAIVWIDQSNQVVDVCLAKSWSPAYLPKRPARYVLEITPERMNDFQVGDRVTWHEVSAN